MKKKYLQLPITYEQSNFDNDDRFVKVRIKVMHNGLNLNNSNFSDPAIEKAASSLSNIPLLAFTKVRDGVDESDFLGHEMEFKITEDGVKYVYLGRPIGMIPETNNYSYQESEDGRKFVTVDGYIWTSYANEALDIIQRDGGKNVSMEIKVNSYGENESVIDITDYKYTGIAFLGEDVPPAMMGARADLAEFSFQGVQEFVANFAVELQNALNLSEDKEPEVPADEPVVEPIIEDPIVEDPIVEDPIVEDPIDPIEDPIVDPVAPVEDPIVDPIEDTVEEPVVPFEEEVSAIKVELDTLRNELESVRKERDELMSYKTGIEKAEYSANLKTLLESFSDIEEDEINKIISKETDLDDIELKLFAVRGKNNTKAPAGHIQTYSIWDSLIKTPHDETPSWVELVEKHHSKDNEGGN